MAVVIAALDTTVLNVAIPTILREFDTTLPSLQWVITGYSLTFAALLIIGGRLGDIFGARRMFIVGAALFGVGSLLASIVERRGRPRHRRGGDRGHGRLADAPRHDGDPVVARSPAASGRPPSRPGVRSWAQPSRSGRSSAASSPRTTRGGGRSAST